MQVTYELLCGGPLDGLPVPMAGLTEWRPDEATASEYPGSKWAKYVRRSDGRLHHEFSKWDWA